MTKLIGIKELQTNTKRIREAVGKGVRFIVIYRSQPIFEIKPISPPIEFVDDFEAESIYTKNFIRRMREAEENIKTGETKKYSTEEFLKSLA